MQITTFAQLYIGTVGFYFHILFVWFTNVSVRVRIIPHMFQFKQFALFWYFNTSNGA